MERIDVYDCCNQYNGIDPRASNSPRDKHIYVFLNSFHLLHVDLKVGSD